MASGTVVLVAEEAVRGPEKTGAHVQNNSAVPPRRPLHPAPAFRHCAGRRRLAQSLHQRGALPCVGTPGRSSPTPAAAANQTQSALVALPCGAAPDAKADEVSTCSPPTRSCRSPVLLQARLEVSLETLLSVRGGPVSDGRSSAGRLTSSARRAVVSGKPHHASWTPSQAAMPRD